MKKYMLIFCIFLLLIGVTNVLAQETKGEITLSQRFPTLRMKDQFNQNLPVKYYRFPPDTWFFDPLDLSYFPHEKWEKDEWTLLGRWKDGKTYNQIIYLDKPERDKVIHGTEIGSAYGNFKNFYLYADLFVVDNYPQDSGSCYLYFSNSVMTGLNDSKGLMIDPESGIYEVTNSYGGNRYKTYDQYSIKHNFTNIKSFSKGEYQINLENIAGTSIGAISYPQSDFDGQFSADYELLTSSYRNPVASPVKAYRIEVIREDEIVEIYINGQLAASIKDKISDNISVSYGPILQPGGLVVNCAIGNLYIYSK